MLWGTPDPIHLSLSQVDKACLLLAAPWWDCTGVGSLSCQSSARHTLPELVFHMQRMHSRKIERMLIFKTNTAMLDSQWEGC